VHRKIALVLIISLITVSCGSRRTYQTQAPTQSFSSFAIVEIPDFKSDIPNTPADTLWRMPNSLAKKLKSKNVYDGVSRSQLDFSNGVLIVDATITEIQPPEWYKQVIKTGTIIITVRFIDKAESLVIAESSFEGKAKWGLLGGGMVFADVRAIDEIVDYLKDNYSPKKN